VSIVCKYRIERASFFVFFTRACLYIKQTKKNQKKTNQYFEHCRIVSRNDF
jgi:hypothetical protein